MSALLRWRQAWTNLGQSTPYLAYEEGWADSWPLGSVTLATVGHTGLTASLSLGITFDLDAGDLAATGHSLPSVLGVSYPTEFVPNIGGTLPSGGRTTITGTFDFEEPFFVDPPLQVYPVGRMAMTATTVMLVNKSIGTGLIPVGGRARMGTAVFGYQIAVVKQLFSVTLPMIGRTLPAATIGSTSVKDVGSGSIGMSGRSTIAQSGFTIEAPAPYTHPVGSALLSLIGASEIVGDTPWTDIPPFDIGSVVIGFNGHSTVSTDRLFAGGVLIIPAMSLTMNGRTVITSRFSLPGLDFAETEISALYEGFDMQELFASYEGDEVSVQ